MRRAASQLAQFQAANGFVDSSSHTQDVVSHASQIDGQIETLQIDSREAVALLNNVRGQMGGTQASIVNQRQVAVNPVLSDLRTKLAEVEVQLAQARQQYTDQHPTVIALTKQRDDLRAQINSQPNFVEGGDVYAPNPVYESLAQEAAQYESRIDGDAAKLSELRRERAALSPVLKALPVQGMQLAALQQRATLTSNVYNALQQKYNDATIARTTAISDLTLIQPATPESAVSWPSLKINLMVALVVGILLASLIVFFLDYFQGTVRDASDVKMMMGLPVIASIPQFTSSNTRALPWLKSMTVESFLHLCISLRLGKKRPLRTLAITSPSKGDGKSTVAFNLAKSMATIYPRVLLIDADFRHPTLHEYAARDNDFGLLQVLRGECSLDTAVQGIVPQLDLLSTGGREIMPVAALQTEQFDAVVREAAGRYSMVIIDTPALGAVPDGYAICSKTDGTAIVIAANATNERVAQQVIEQLRSLAIENIVGVVLNKDRQRLRDYSDYFASSVESTPTLPGATS
jgi:capsular exopolysaccharide synthesis family protein